MAKILPITPTLLNEFLTCPYKYHAHYVTKEVGFTKTIYTEWGIKVHGGTETALINGTAVPADVGFMQPLVDWVRTMVEAGYELVVEGQLAIDDNFKQTNWFAGTIKAKLDILLVNRAARHAIIVDWKTGTPKDDPLQAKISALLVKYCYQIDNVLCLWVHVKDKMEQVIKNDLNLFDLSPVSDVFDHIKEYKAACTANSFPPKPSGLCKNWCDAFSCPHNGRKKPDVQSDAIPVVNS